MTVRVRFAPSPTGYLHIGGARTALYNYLFAKAHGGTYVLRVEDTDLERSSREFEEAQRADLKWLGILHQEGPDVGGDYGPYRQSERLDLYKKYADNLVEKGQAYTCFCTDEELEKHKEECQSRGLAPHYSGKCRNLSPEELNTFHAQKIPFTVRFKAPVKSYVFNDNVRGRVVFPENMVGDFVIMRSNGLPVYNYCCVVDDWLMKITHVIRAEEHLPNTLRQLMIYEAFGATPPEFAHVSLLVGSDRQKLSKRHGASSVDLYRQDHYLPQAMLNYLCLLGWSHPEGKDIFNVFELGTAFTMDRFSKSPAMYDVEKLNWVNGQYLKLMSEEHILREITGLFSKEHSFFTLLTEEKRLQVVKLFKEQCLFYKDFLPHIETLFHVPKEWTDDSEEMKGMLALPSTLSINTFLKEKIKAMRDRGEEFMTEAQFQALQEEIKTSLSVKGKPLFMGIRVNLTGICHGSELKFLLPLTPLSVLTGRLELLSTLF
jgi:glutamyl-tRNA synthetase